MNIIDLSVYKKDDLVITSLTGEEYHIPGNFSTEFYVYLYDSYNKVQKLTKNDFSKAVVAMKGIALEIIKLDKSKEPTMETIEQQFDDFRCLQMLISEMMKYANEVANDPNSESPTLK